ncbi:hypothetical protein QFZ82_002839 [Streptomyces sp. V4I23]|nr:hypothetical protein [Streptomyces sp. V4I23]
MTMPDTVEGREAVALLERTSGAVQPELRSAVDTLPSAVRRVARYHVGWEQADGSPAAGAGGKVIRSALVLAACRALGGDPDRAVRAAAAVELAHNFTPARRCDRQGRHPQAPPHRLDGVRHGGRHRGR